MNSHVATENRRRRPSQGTRTVLHFCPYMHAHAGGPPVVVTRLAEAAHQHEWSSTVLTTPLFCDDGGADLDEQLNNRFCTAVLGSTGLRAAINPLNWGLIRDLISGVAIVHIHTLWSPLAGVVARISRQQKVPYIVSPHGMLDPYSLSVNSLRKILYLHAVEAKILRGSHCLVFTTDVERDLARISWPNNQRSAVIELGADVPPNARGDEIAKPFLDLFRTAAGRKCILFLGRLHPKKQVETAIDAIAEVAKRIPEALLLVAGSGDAGYEGALRQRVKEKGLTDHVLFTGPLNGALKDGAFAASKAFVLPSLQENFAIAVAEAMHAGLPVIVSRAVNLSLAIADAKAGLIIEPSDSRGLALAIVSLLTDPSLSEQLGQNGRRLAASDFSWNRTAKRTYALYDEILLLSNA